MNETSEPRRPRGRKERLARALERTRATRILLGVRGRLRRRALTVLTYHSVADIDPGYRFDPEIIDAAPAEFGRQLEFLARYCSVVGLDEALDGLRGGSLPPNAVMLTFDDGYKSCHDVALPLLRRHGLSATFFIATDAVEKRQLFWWDLLHFVTGEALRSGARQKLHLSYPSSLPVDLRAPDTIANLLGLLKTQPGLDPRRFVLSLAREAGVEFDETRERMLAEPLILTWEDLTRMLAAGMNIEAHTRSHRVLQTVPKDELSNELKGSKACLEAALGHRVRALAYPAGPPIVKHAHLLDAVADAKFEAGFSNATGINPSLPDAHRFNVRRVAMDIRYSLDLFKARLALPELLA